MSAGEPRISLVSNLTGQLAGPDYGTVGYWVDHVRKPVRFVDGVQLAESLGAGVFLEVGPGAALTSAVEQSLTIDRATSVVTMAKGRPEVDSLLRAAGQLFTAGADVRWAGAFADAHRVELPTYAFVRRRFWLSSDSVGSANIASLGLAEAEHALLGAVVERPDSGGVVLTGRLSIAAQPWLADHAVAGTVLFPGAGFVELALRAGDEVGCPVIEELTLSAPLSVPAAGVVHLQVVVGAPGETGARSVAVYSRAAQSDWMLHAEGVLSDGAPAPTTDLSVWPPLGAEPVDLTGAYDGLAARGYGYGPAFQGLRAVWRRGAETFAEVELPQQAGVSTGGLGIHPVVLDAALHALGVADERIETVLPFSWQGVSLYAAGASRVRVRLAPGGAGAVSVELADSSGLPVLSVRELVTRAVSADQLTAAVAARSGSGELLDVVWSPVSLPGNDVGDNVTVWEPPSAGADPVTSVYAATHDALGVMQSWLTGEAAGPLVVLTHGAVGLAGEDVADLAGAAVWGLVRSAQAEHPGRVVLVDTDGTLDVATVIGCGEPQLVVRDGAAYSCPAEARRTAAAAAAARAAVGVAPGRRRRRNARGSGGAGVPAGSTGGRSGAGDGRRRRGELPRCAGGAGHVPGGRAAGRRGCGHRHRTRRRRDRSGRRRRRHGDLRAGRFRGRRRSPVGDPGPAGLVDGAGRGRAGGVLDGLLRAVGAGRPARRAAGPGARRHRRRGHGRRTAGPALGRRGVHDRQPRQVGHLARHGF